MAENRKGKDSRFYFSRGQMILLGAAFTLASLIIFMMGVFVGKGIEGRKLLKNDEPLVKIPIRPGAAETNAPTAQPKNEITFNESLPKSPVTPPAPEEQPKAAKSGEKVAKAEIKEASGGARTEPGRTKNANNKSEKSATTEPASKKNQVAAEPIERKDENQTWRAQVNAFPDERSAKQIVERLKIKGYNAYVSEVQNRGKNWYRVSVGKFSSRDEADKMVELLRTKENFPKAFAATR